jgi:NAD(P)-dependent dehydrogenase (short-subunit alcohol dehydrogenase family)
MNELKRQVAVITGAANGIGRATAEAFAAEGAQLVLVDRDEKAAQRLATRLGKSGRRVRVLAADVAEPETAEQAAKLALDSFKRIDILVNSAGVQRYGSVVDTTEGVWDEVMNVNLKSAYRFCRECVPAMQKAGRGAIVNVASVQALATQRGVAAYTASKGGLVALTRSIALDFAPAIRANAVLPGSVDTPMLRNSARLFAADPNDALREWGAMHPLGRVAKAHEVAQVILFLASQRSSFVTGAGIMVDGGLLVKIPGT